MAKAKHTPAKHLIDEQFIRQKFLDRWSVNEIYKAEYHRINVVEGHDVDFTKGVIIRAIDRYRHAVAEMYNDAPPPIETYVYGMEPPRTGALPIYNGQFRLDGDWLILSDTHYPFHDQEFMNRCVETALSHGITQCIIAGDVMQNDNKGKWAKLVPAPPPYVERKAVTEGLTWLAKTFDLLVVEPGNHDRWHIRHSDGVDTFQGFIQSLVHGLIPDNILFTEYDRVVIESAGETWVVPHQTDYSKIAGRVAQQLINKYRANVIVPHQHYSGAIYDEWLYNVGIDIGGCMSPELMAYANMNTDKKRPMQSGSALIQNGQGVLLTKEGRLGITAV